MRIKKYKKGIFQWDCLDKTFKSSKHYKISIINLTLPDRVLFIQILSNQRMDTRSFMITLRKAKFYNFIENNYYKSFYNIAKSKKSLKIISKQIIQNFKFQLWEFKYLIGE